MNPSLWAWLSLGGVVLLLTAVIWSIRRHRDPILEIDCDVADRQLMPSLAGLTLGTAVAGNSVEVLENGAYFDVLIERIRCGAADRCISRPSCGRKACWVSASGGCALRAGARRRAGARAARRRPARKDVGKAARRAACARPDARSCTSTSGRFATSACSTTATTASSSVIDGREAFVGGHCIVDDVARRRGGRQALRRRQRAAARPYRAQRAGGVQRELGGGNRRAVRRRRRLPRARAGGRRADPRRLPEARGLGAGGEDPAPHR